jgi:hypothetical protein
MSLALAKITISPPAINGRSARFDATPCHNTNEIRANGCGPPTKKNQDEQPGKEASKIGRKPWSAYRSLPLCC